MKISFITSTFVVALTALAAYSFSRFRFKGRRIGLLGLLLVQMFPQMLAIVALYVLLLTMGHFFPFAGMNTHTGLILIYLGGAMGFNTWLMKGYFDTIPRSLEESAKVDGATPFQAFTKILLPLVRPILATIFVLTFISIYSDFLIACDHAAHGRTADDSRRPARSHLGPVRHPVGSLLGRRRRSPPSRSSSSSSSRNARSSRASRAEA